MLFNLIPFPPLDGYGILEVWLPQTLQSSLRKFALLGLIAIGVTSFFSPFTQLIVRSAFTLTQLFGVPEAMSLAGLELFNRWYCALLLMAIGAFFLLRKPQSLYFFLGEIAASCRKLDWAFAIYDRAVQLAPRDAWAWARRGWLLLALIQSPGLLSRKRLEDSLQSFSHAIQIKPDYYFPWAGRGWALYLSGRYAEAIVAYEQAIDLEQDDHLVWNERGVVLVSLNRYDEALDSFNRAIVLRPDLNWLRQRRDLLQGKVILNS